MGIGWNPNYPRILGIEYVAAGGRHEVVDSPLDQNVLVWEARRTGEIDAVDLFGGPGTSTPALSSRYASKARPMILDIYEEGDEAYTVNSTLYAPTAVTGIGSIVNENLTQPVTLSRITAPNDGLFMAAPAIGDGTRVQFNTGAFPLDRRVLSVVIGMRINVTARLRRLDNLALSSEANVWFEDVPMLTPTFETVEVTWGEVKVDAGTSTWTHWTPQNIRDFRAGGPRQIAITCRAAPGGWRIDYAYMRVFWTTENRIGLGINQGPLVPFDWNRFTLVQTDGSGSPSLTQGVDMSMALRRIVDYSVHNVAGPTAFSWRHLRGYDLENKWRSHAMRQTPLVSVDGLGAEREGIATGRFIDASASTEDTQPYEWQRSGRAYDGADVTQIFEVTAGASTTIYGQVYAFVGFDHDKRWPEAPLVIEVLEGPSGEDGTLFSAVEVTADEVSRLRNISPRLADHDDQNTDYRQVRLRFPESRTIPIGTHVIRLSSPGTSRARAWRIGALIASDAPGDQTYGGFEWLATGEWISYLTGQPDVLAGGPNSWVSDLQVALAEVPAAVTGVGIAAGSLETHRADVCQGSVCQGCGEPANIFSAVTWSPSPSGSPDVAGYEIDRMDDVTPWERVATVWGRLTDRWEDMEARLGVTTLYRVRAVRTDEVTGDWSEPTSIVLPDDQVSLSLTSNAATGMGVIYPEVWAGAQAERNFQFLEAGDVTYTSMYGRHKQVAFRPMERKGDRFTRTLLLNAFCAVELPSRARFSPLQDLAWAPIPYVCVRDGEGNRWYASVEVPEGDIVYPDVRMFAEIVVVEVADQPHVQDTSVPQVTEVIPL